MVKLKKVLICTIPTRSSFSRLGRCGRESKAGEKWPPIRLMYLAGNLRKRCKILFLDGDADSESIEDFRKKVLAFSPDYIIMEPVQNSFKEEMKEIGFLRKKIKFKLIATGTFVSTFYENLIKNDIDIIALGEPEENLLNYLTKGTQRGLIFYRGGKLYHYPGSTVVRNLDSLEFPSHDLLNKQSYASPFIRSHPFTVIETSRGCPFMCTYCSAPVISGKNTRFRSPENIIQEIKWVLSLGFKEIKFNDETFTLDRNRIIKILELVKQNKLKFNWKCNSRADLLDERLLRLMKQTGCHLIFIGVESGNQKILDSYKKGITLEKIKKGFKLCKDIGIDTVAHFMIGAPDDSKKTIKESVDFAISLGATYTSFNLLVPYPKTPIYYELEDKKLFERKIREEADPLRNSVIKTKYLSSSELENELKQAYIRFYFSPRYIIKKFLSLKSFEEFKSNIKGFFGLIHSLR